MFPYPHPECRQAEGSVQRATGRQERLEILRQHGPNGMSLVFKIKQAKQPFAVQGPFYGQNPLRLRLRKRNLPQPHGLGTVAQGYDQTGKLQH